MSSCLTGPLDLDPILHLPAIHIQNVDSLLGLHLLFYATYHAIGNVLQVPLVDALLACEGSHELDLIT